MSGSRVCDIGYERPEVSDQRIVVACKPQCGDTIHPGDKYEVISGLWDGEWLRFKTCTTCVAARDDLLKCGYIFGSVWEHIGECYDIDPEFLPGYTTEED